MVDITVIRPEDDGGQPKLLVAPTGLDIAMYQKLRPGKPGGASVFYPRSLRHLRWYRGLIGIVADARGMHPDELHADLKFKAGLVQRILLSDAGKPYVELKSVAFRRGEQVMDEAEFTEYRIIAVNLIFRDYLDPTDKPEVWRRVEELCGPCPW